MKEVGGGARLVWAKKMTTGGKTTTTVYYWVCNNRCNSYNNTPRKWVKKENRAIPEHQFLTSGIKLGQT